MNLTVNEFTTPCPLVISTETTVIEAFEMMQKEGIHHLPVSENGQIKGVVSDRDLRLLTVGPGEKTPVGNLISGETFSIHRNTSLEDAALEMGNKRVGSLLVTDNHGEVEGIFTVTDALNALVEVIRDVETGK